MVAGLRDVVGIQTHARDTRGKHFVKVRERIVVPYYLVILAHIDLCLEHYELVFLVVVELDVTAVVVVGDVSRFT